jgi:hypothetical protein
MSNLYPKADNINIFSLEYFCWIDTYKNTSPPLSVFPKYCEIAQPTKR